MIGNWTRGLSDQPILSVIIVNWNTRDLLAECLRSLEAECEWKEDGRSEKEKADPGSSLFLLPSSLVEVFIVDNASSDDSAAMVRDRFPWVQLIENSENVGFARANNQAIQASAGRYVLLLNPDTVVLPGALQELVRFMEDHPDAGVAGARLLNPDGSLQPSCSLAPTLKREFWRLFHLDRLVPYGGYDMRRWRLDVPREVDNVQGAALLVRRDVLEGVGFLDEDYFIYTEEVDLCQRIRDAGWRVCWVPGAQVMHYGGQSTQQVREEMFLELYGSKVRYFRKHFGRTIAVAYKVILAAAVVVRLGLAPLGGLGSRQTRERNNRLTSNYRQLLGSLSHM